MGTFQSTRSETMGLPGARVGVGRALASAYSGRTAYARSRGLGAAAEPSAAGSAADGFQAITLGVRELQQELIRAGYPIGHTGADSIFGPATATALQRFVNAKIPGTQYSIRSVTGNDHAVILSPQVVWQALRAQPTARNGGSGSTSQSARTPQIEIGPPQIESMDGGGGVGWLGVGLATLGLLGVGVAIWAGTK